MKIKMRNKFEIQKLYS